MTVVDINQLLGIAREYKEIPYLLWISNVEDEQACFCTDRIYSKEELNKRGINCAAFINILYIRLFGLPAHGEQLYGIIWWGATLRKRELFHPELDYPPGTLLFRRFRDWTDQGHLAMVTEGGMLIHSWPVSGVEEEVIDEIHWCDREKFPNGYFEFTVKPGDWLKKTLVKDRWK
ncbi:MAG: hypothetical protein S4CHLAM20_14800 [Chlamydiia bacterium]|nr:hypothetical protein [Chlamydiia bacterium]